MVGDAVAYRQAQATLGANDLTLKALVQALLLAEDGNTQVFLHRIGLRRRDRRRAKRGDPIGYRLLEGQHRDVAWDAGLTQSPG